MKIKIALALSFAAAVTAAPAYAQDEPDSKWFVRLAGTRLSLADKLDLSLAGTPVPNAGMNTPPHYTPTVHIGRVVTRDLAVVLTVGIPPHINIDGRDALQPFGRLAETTYGPTCLTVQFRPVHKGVLRPYVGAGATYMFVFSETDGAFQNVKIDEDLGPTLEAGTDIMVNNRYGFFVEAKKAFLRTQAHGTFGGAPVLGDVKLDPWAVSVGAVVRF
jgi:outer membrane protein